MHVERKTAVPIFYYLIDRVPLHAIIVKNNRKYLSGLRGIIEN